MGNINFSHINNPNLYSYDGRGIIFASYINGVKRKCRYYLYYKWSTTMNKFSLSTAGILVAALLTSVSVNAATDNAKTEVTPKGMNCQSLLI